LDGFFTEPELELAVEHVPGLLEPLVHVQPGVKSGRGAPFGAS
jgi:hypothetical protein